MGANILWAIVAGFLSGVFAQSFFPMGMHAVWFVALFAIVALFVPLLDHSYSTYSISVAFALIAFGVGIFRMDTATLTHDPLLAESLDTRITVVGTVTDEPDQRETNILVPIQVNTLVVASSSLVVHAKILAHIPPHTRISYGDTVRVSGTLRTPRAFDSGLGRQFDYPKYLAVNGITFQLTNAYIDTVGENHGNIVKASAIRLKQLYLAGLAQALPEPEAGLAGGITVGDKRSIGPELSEVFRRVSLVHIVVLSGYNITIVISAIGKIFSWLPRTVDFGISGIVVLFFVLMTGGASSALRAGAMALMAMYARVSGRVFLAIRALGVFSLVLVLWNPYTLAYDPSFQLSVLATLGLILFTPLVSLYLQWITERWQLREIAAATIGTQIAVLPLLLYQNGTLSLVALPANLLALIPIPFTMFLSFIAAIAGVVLGPFAVIVGFPAYVSLAYIIAVAKILGALPFAALTVPAFSAIWMFTAYALMFGGIWYVQKKSGKV
ncbi:MAG: ComEC/Rec2 family competence protein [bacterium]|nr:ComEC/Rec2 family competence protein [bacterium]